MHKLLSNGTRSQEGLRIIRMRNVGDWNSAVVYRQTS